MGWEGQCCMVRSIGKRSSKPLAILQISMKKEIIFCKEYLEKKRREHEKKIMKRKFKVETDPGATNTHLLAQQIKIMIFTSAKKCFLIHYQY